MHPLAQAVSRSELVERFGRVVALHGHIVEAHGPRAPVGEVCRIAVGEDEGIEAEVLGFRRDAVVLMPSGPVERIRAGARVVASGRRAGIPVGAALLGRVVDASGRPVDGGAPLPALPQRELRAAGPAPMQRGRVQAPLETGLRALDGLLPLARGQRVGLFAGSGVGKSSLLGALAQGTAADVVVLALIGERSREVREFVEDRLGAEALRRAVVVVATAAEPAVLRLRAAYAATAIAEHFRDQGRHVLLLMDSLTRFAMARREIGLAAGEPPTARGYTPSVFAELPQLCERSGAGAGGGSISAFYTVLVDGDDLNEPLSDAIRGLLDGHLVLSREIAQAGRHPAIDVLRSVSRLKEAVSTPADLAAARRILASCALFERNRSLVEVGAYQPGVRAELDRALAAAPRIEAFLAQPARRRVARDDALAQMRQLAATLETDHVAR
jgi:flagellum-specific ATP synthase